MTNLPAHPFGLTIFCDDIRQEANGKTILIGVYGDAMTIQGVAPARLNQLMLAVHYVEPKGYDESQVLFRLMGPDNDTPLFETEIVRVGSRLSEGEELQEEVAQHFIWRAQLAVRDLVIPEPGYLKAQILRGKQVIKAGSLEVLFYDPASEDSSSAEDDNINEPPTGNM